MIIGILKEPEFEKRVSMLPETVISVKNLNSDVYIEHGAGSGAFISDGDYQAAGAVVVDASKIYSDADLIISIHPLQETVVKLLNPQQILLSLFSPFQNIELLKKVAVHGNTVFSFDMIPRTTRAQAMDILSSMATVSGYRAVLDAALISPRFFPMFMSAAGTIKPSKVLILGAGVAGLQAIATSRKLGAVVEVFDVRAAVKEEVMSLGGKFIEVEGARDDKSAGGYAVEQTEEFKTKQKQLIHEHAVKSNIVITTAQIPGKKAPVLLTRESVESMAPGSVVIDLAASTGGNCEVTKNNETIIHKGVFVKGKSDYPSDMSYDASKMVSNNIFNFLKLLINKEGNVTLNWDDEIIKGACIAHNKEISNEKFKNI